MRPLANLSVSLKNGYGHNDQISLHSFSALLAHLIPTTILGGRLLLSYFIDEETGTPTR